MYSEYGPDWTAALWIKLIRANPEVLMALRQVQVLPTVEGFERLMDSLKRITTISMMMTGMTHTDLKRVMQRVFILIDGNQP